MPLPLLLPWLLFHTKYNFPSTTDITICFSSAEEKKEKKEECRKGFSFLLLILDSGNIVLYIYVTSSSRCQIPFGELKAFVINSRNLHILINIHMIYRFLPSIWTYNWSDVYIQTFFIHYYYYLYSFILFINSTTNILSSSTNNNPYSHCRAHTFSYVQLSFYSLAPWLGIFFKVRNMSLLFKYENDLCLNYKHGI